MIVCHPYRFIFIKTRKTAGSSLEIGLSRACGEGDIVTPLSRRLGEDALRRAEGGYGPAGWEKPVWEHRGLREWFRLLRGRRAERFREHATAVELRELLPEDVWSSYYKFTIERNPWDRAVSRYFWQKHRWERKDRGRPFPSLSDYLRWMEKEKPHWISNWTHYAIGDEIVVDRVLLYENLSGELELLRSKLGIGEDISLPKKKAKSGFRKDRRHYAEILSRQDRELIERLCWREIEAFGYRFEERRTGT